MVTLLLVCGVWIWILCFDFCFVFCLYLGVDGCWCFVVLDEIVVLLVVIWAC